MKILAHRGCWNAEIKGNSHQALRSALEHGFGFESDLRDYCGELVISHNVANASCQNAEEVFRWLEEFNDQYCFAINIKADGMKEMLTESLKRHRIKNYFTFDMSVPQMVEFQQQGLVYFTRQSEIEPVPVMYETAAGVWIDGFWSSDWITQKLLEKHIVYGKTVCIVSPDLHGRPYLDFWARLYKLEINFDKVMLCTDYPFEACEFFRG